MFDLSGEVIAQQRNGNILLLTNREKHRYTSVQNELLTNTCSGARVYLMCSLCCLTTHYYGSITSLTITVAQCQNIGFHSREPLYESYKKKKNFLLFDKLFKQYTRTIQPCQITQNYTNVNITTNMVIVYIINNTT